MLRKRRGAIQFPDTELTDIRALKIACLPRSPKCAKEDAQSSSPKATQFTDVRVLEIACLHGLAISQAKEGTQCR